MANEAEVVAVLQEGNMMKLNVVDTAKMSYIEQLKVRTVGAYMLLFRIINVLT